MHIIVVVKDQKDTRRDDRHMGWFSYPVPGLTWDFLVPGKRFTIDTKDLARQGYAAIVHEDFGSTGTYTGGAIPLIYQDIDSTLSEYHFGTRQNIAAQADLILVDQAPLDTFAYHGKPIYRHPYCVNDVFIDHCTDKGQAARTVDVALHHNKNQHFIRQMLGAVLPELARSLNMSAVQGSVGFPEFATSIGRARVVLNWPRVPTNRPHRVFDVMAAGAALLTGPLPSVDGDLRRVGEHYRVFTHWGELATQLSELVHMGEWDGVGQSGERLVRTHHTWAVRALQFRTILETHRLWK